MDKVTEGVEGHRAAIKVLVSEQDGRTAQEDRVAIRCGAGDGLPCDIAAGAWPILDHHGLAEQRCHAFAQQPRGDVRRAAGREWHHNLHGALREGLRLGEA